jgi:TolB protein
MGRVERYDVLDLYSAHAVIRRAVIGVVFGLVAAIAVGCDGGADELHADSSRASVQARTQGDTIMFGRVVGNRGNVFAVRVGSKTTRQVTRFPKSGNALGASEPAWSPDGRRVVFVRDTDSEGSNESEYWLYTVAADGSRLRRLTGPAQGILSSPAWSPDGRRIAYSRWRGEDKQTIEVIDVNRPRVSKRLGEGPEEDGSPAWSPDGGRIAFDRGSDIWSMNADGSDARKLIEDGDSPAWSPDGSSIVFSSSRDGRGETCYDDGCDPNREIYIARADGSDQRRLTRTDSDDWHPTWSPDSRWIAFSAGYEGFAHRLFVMRSDGRCRRTMLGLAVSPTYPSWQPGRPDQAGRLRCRSFG